MRLFVAIDLPDEAKAELWYTAQRLEHQAQHARVVPRENYHLTLVFIGETSRVNEAREALCRVRLPKEPIEMTFSGVGSFRQQRDYTWWVGIETTDALKALADELALQYRAADFSIESRSFKPHITLARKVSTLRPVELSAPRFSFRPDHLSLMRSINEGGRMVYTEIDSLTLYSG